MLEIFACGIRLRIAIKLQRQSRQQTELSESSQAFAPSSSLTPLEVPQWRLRSAIELKHGRHFAHVQGVLTCRLVPHWSLAPQEGLLSDMTKETPTYRPSKVCTVLPFAECWS